MRSLVLAVLISLPALAADFTLTVLTVPPGAEVKLDGAVLGPSPAETTTRAGKHTVSVSLEGYKPQTKKLNLKGNERLTLTLVDIALEKATRALEQAKANYEKRNMDLERLQSEGGSEQKLAAAEEAMVKASDALETAEREFEAVRKSRTSPEQLRAEAERQRAVVLGNLEKPRPETRSPTGLSRTDAGVAAVGMKPPSGPPLQAYVCAYSFVFTDKTKMKSCAGGNCTTTTQTDTTASACMGGTYAAMDEARRACEEDLKKKTERIAGTPDRALRCDCASSKSDLPPRLVSLCP